MKLYKMNCESCGANLEIDLDKLTAYCPYCGAKLLFDIEKMQGILKAKIHEEATTERTKILKDAEIERCKIEKDSATKKAELVFSAIFLVFACLFFIGVVIFVKI